MHSFETFLSDVGERPPGTTLDRWPNPNGDYEPGNVRWASSHEQARNKDCNHFITVDSETLTLTEWAERTGVPRSIIYTRINRLGWEPEKAISTPVRTKFSPTRK